MYFLYILKSLSDNFIYKGITNNLDRRIEQHNNREVSSTKNHIPLKLIYCEEFNNRIEAREREKYFKSGFGREIVKEIAEEMENQ